MPVAPATGKTNWLLWGDSLAAHYFHGLRKGTDPQAVNILQATQAACMPTLERRRRAMRPAAALRRR